MDTHTLAFLLLMGSDEIGLEGGPNNGLMTVRLGVVVVLQLRATEEAKEMK